MARYKDCGQDQDDPGLFHPPAPFLQAAPRSACPRIGMHFLFQPVFEGLQCHFHVVMRLEVEPELRFHVEIPPEPERGIGGDSPAPMDDFIDTPGSDADVFRDPVLADPQGQEKLFEKDFSGVDGGKITLCHKILSGNRRFRRRMHRFPAIRNKFAIVY